MTGTDTDGDFLDELGVSPSLRAIVKRSAQEYDETGDWVSFDTLAYEAAERDAAFDISEIFRLPSSIGGAWSSERLNLTGLGIVLSDSAPKTVDLMVRVAEIASERKQRLRDEAKLGHSILIQEYQFSPDDAGRAREVVQLLPGISGGGSLGAEWELMLHRTALDYRHVHDADSLRAVLEGQSRERNAIHAQSLAVAPAFAPGGMFGSAEPGMELVPQPEPSDPTAVFVVHGRDFEAKDAMWSFLSDLGLHPLDWEADLVVQSGQGTPLISDILDAAFARAQAVVVLMTPDDCALLHPDLVLNGEQDFESVLVGQCRPNVLFEAGMAFGHSPTRTILVEVGRLRPITDLGGRHTVRIGTIDTLRALAGRLEAAGCPVNTSSDAWLNVVRFSSLDARSRTAPAYPEGLPSQRLLE